MLDCNVKAELPDSIRSDQMKDGDHLVRFPILTRDHPAPRLTSYASTDPPMSVLTNVDGSSSALFIKLVRRTGGSR